MNTIVEAFNDLNVYKKAFELQQDIFEITKKFPKEETYSLTDQIRRSSRSIGANIAEAWKKRIYPSYFISKLVDSDGELSETIHWINTSQACQYISSETHQELIFKCNEVGRMLGKMLMEPERWCNKKRNSNSNH